MYLDHPLVSQRYFFPRREFLENPHWVESDGLKLACVWQRAPRATNTMVHFHGNGEVVADYLPDFAPSVGGLGVNVLFAEYRGYGMSEGEPALVSMLSDIPAYGEALVSQGVEEEQIVVFGRSVGSIYAIEFAHRYPRIAGLVLESSIAHPLERVLLRARPQELGTDLKTLESEAEKHLSHKTKLRGYDGPLLVMHAALDDLVPPRNAELNYQWAASQQKELVLFPQGDHNSILWANREAYWSQVKDFLALAAA